MVATWRVPKALNISWRIWSTVTPYTAALSRSISTPICGFVMARSLLTSRKPPIFSSRAVISGAIR